MTDIAPATSASGAFSGYVEHFEPLDPELPNGYWEYSDGLRDTRPVVRSDGHWSTEDTGFWLLSRHDDVFHAAADWQTYSSANGATPVQFPVEMFRMIPLEVDPPLHRHVRRLLNPFFTPEAVAAAEQAAGSIADALLDECVAQGECDFVGGFANLLPAQVFFRYFLDAADDQSKIPWVVQTILTMFEFPDKALEVAPGLFAWYAELLQNRREAGRREDLIGVIAHAGLDEASDGFVMDDKQRLETLNMVVLAGMETTAAGLGNIAHHLATDQELRASLRGADDDALAHAVDEFLRHDPPVPLAGRTLTKDVELRGCPMRAGDRIMLNWAGASRDPEVFPNPEVLDFTRANVAKHSSFGAGVHRCMGNHLARRELKAAIRAIAELGTFELVDGAEVNWRAAFARGPHTLPVRIGR
jgi:cytochrome P450